MCLGCQHGEHGHSDPSMFGVCYAGATERQQNKKVRAASGAWLKEWFMESKMGKGKSRTTLVVLGLSRVEEWPQDD